MLYSQSLLTFKITKYVVELKLPNENNLSLIPLHSALVSTQGCWQLTGLQQTNTSVCKASTGCYGGRALYFLHLDL